MEKTRQTPLNYQKKVFTRLTHSDLSAINPQKTLHAFQSPPLNKKIVATSLSHHVREQFKKTFVPLLIEVFELRQQLSNIEHDNSSPFSTSSTLCVDEITAKLQRLKKEIEETKRWCEGVELQIEKGLQDAQKLIQRHQASQVVSSRIKSFFFNAIRFLKSLLKRASDV
jgi:hypothetical protein